MMKYFKIISFNAKGITPTKCAILSDLQADILTPAPPTIYGMHLIIHFPHLKHGSAMYARDKSVITTSQDLSHQDIEILRVETAQLVITSVYKPPNTPFSWPQITNPDNKPQITIGDFNSHNTIWGYDKNNTDEEAVEYWAATPL